MTIYKAFQEALTYANSDSFRMKKFMKDKRLNFDEKKIIQGYIFLRETRFNEILESIGPITAMQPWVCAHRSLLLGITFNNKCDPTTAVSHLLLALSEFENIQDPIYLFSCHYNLFCSYLNLNEPSAMGLHLDGMEQFRYTLPHYGDIILRCKFNLLITSQQTMKAFDVLHLLQNRFEGLNQNQKINFLIDKFCFYLSLNRLKDAFEILEEMKSYKAFALSANFKFMRTFLSFLMDGKAFYIYEKDFKEFPLLYRQAMVLSLLDQNDIAKAQAFWQQLQTFSPTVYKEDFEYNGVQCLFSRCLEKLTPDQASRPVIESSENRQEQLRFFFESANGPVSKEALYEAIWGVPASTKDDFTKLSQLIFRVNKKYHIEIRSKKGNYQLIKPAA